jgi:hypothetical protein
MLSVAAIGAGGSILGGLFGASAAKKAAKIQAENAKRVADMAVGEKQKGVAESYAGEHIANVRLSDVYGQEQNALAPYLNAGAGAVTTLSNMTKPGGALASQFSFDPSQVANDPGYKFRLEQGQLALERSAAARGQTFSGGTLKALTGYGQDMASQEYQAAYNRALSTFATNRTTALQPLNTLLNLGQNATGMFGSAAQNYGNTSAANAINTSQYRGNLGMDTARIAGEALTGGANARAAGVVGGANALTSGISGATNDIMSGLLLSKMLNPAVGSVSTGLPDDVVPGGVAGGIDQYLTPTP